MEDANTSKFIGRWKHRDKLVFRVWPKYKETHLAIVKHKEIPIDWLSVSGEGKMEAQHQSKMIRKCVFELRDEDVDLLAMAGAADIRLHLDRMVVHAPGTLDEKVKKECWLEVPFTAYPSAPWRTRSDECASSSHIAPKLPSISCADIEVELRNAGWEFGKIVTIESVDEIDEDLICREVVENNAVIAFSGGGVPGARAKEIMTRASYWVVPGREPDEDGGLLRGYQFCDRFVRWHYKCPEGERSARRSEHMEKMHEVVREIGRSHRRVYFTDQVVNRFAERIGMSRQRVASRFLDDGVTDWLVRSAEVVKPKMFHDAKLTMSPLANRAVDAIEFYYRALEKQAEGEK